jgi:hypothetical protein
MITSIIISLIIIYICTKKPIVGIALLLQTNIIRALAELDYKNPCFHCSNDVDIFLGAITPLIAFLIILITQVLKGKLKYYFDAFDLFFFCCVIIFFFTSLYSVNILDSFTYSIRFVFLGSPYYFLGKLIILNTNDYVNEIKLFFKTTLVLSSILGTFGLIFYFIKADEFVLRLTIPGVHPIPYSQLIGFGLIISFIVFITNGAFFEIQSKRIINLNKILLIELTLILFATNTRGVMLASAVSIFIYLLIAKVKIKKQTIYLSGAALFLVLIAIVSYIDVEVLFRRILSPYTSKSEGDRFIAYSDSLELLFKYPLGAGADTFKDLSILPYPHNIFLECIAHFGIFGVFLSLFILFLIIYMIYTTAKYYLKQPIITLILSVFIFFLIETMFSFTLPMHKGLYLMMGFFAAILYKTRFDNKYA